MQKFGRNLFRVLPLDQIHTRQGWAIDSNMGKIVVCLACRRVLNFPKLATCRKTISSTRHWNGDKVRVWILIKLLEMSQYYVPGFAHPEAHSQGQSPCPIGVGRFLNFLAHRDQPVGARDLAYALLS
jgi:hypothetical protein